MTREEAINVVRSIYQTDAEREALAILVPELREREDERMLRTIIRGFECWKGNGNMTFNNTKVDDILAYLEKQKEQKPAEWSEEDNIGWDEAFACVTRAEKAAKNEEELQNAVTAEKWLKEIKFKYYVHPVKQEWSEEDEKKYQCIRCILLTDMDKKIGSWKYSEILEWYEKRGIGRYTNSRPSWKPSEQEKGALRTAIHILTEERSFPKAAGHLQAILDAFDGKESRKNWKPSEAQLMALHSVIDDESDTIGNEQLKLLYGQLKKLM